MFERAWRFPRFSSSLARRYLFPKRGLCPQIPRFVAGPYPQRRPPTAWFICPDYQRPSGGIRKLYRCVDILNAAGFNAAIVHSEQGFRCNWFNNETPVAWSGDIRPGSHDVLVVPEIYGHSIRSLPSGIRQVIFNQNVYNTIDLQAAAPIHSSSYTDNPELVLVMVVSQDNADVLKSMFPSVPVQRIRLGLDPTLYHLPTGPKSRRIAYMPRKRRAEAKDVIEHLRKANAVEGWDVVAIDGRSEAEAAGILRESKLFLSFSKREGFGLPPLEALACGCVVVGYDGAGGREYFQPPLATPVEDGNTIAFAAAVQAAVRSMDEDPASANALASDANRFALGGYSIEDERQSVVNAFAPLLG